MDDDFLKWFLPIEEELRSGEFDIAHIAFISWLEGRRLQINLDLGVCDNFQPGENGSSDKTKCKNCNLEKWRH